MIPLIGYTDRFSARPGEAIAVKVSCTAASRYSADFVEILSADPNPDGPGVRYRNVDAQFNQSYPSRVQKAFCGSYAVVEYSRSVPVGAEWTFSVRVQPWLITADEQIVASIVGIPCMSLVVMQQATVLKTTSTGIIALTAMNQGTWYELRIVVKDDILSFHKIPIRTLDGAPESASASWVARSELSIDRIAFGAMKDEPSSRYCKFFNGRIEDPALISASVTQGEPLDLDSVPRSRVLSWWDFSVEISSAQITDRGSIAAHGYVVNLPTRAVCGSRWSGRHMNWGHAPRDYGAIHFHEDDLYDCGWNTDFLATIPEGLVSGIYGIRLRVEDHEDVIPVFVLPPTGTTQSKVAFLISTFTYQAYANFDRANFDDAYKERRAEWKAYPHHPAEYREFGRSTYDRHPDGSGVVHSSARRPILTCRPAFIAYVDAKGSGLRHFPADMHIADWMRARKIDFDVVTDHDIDREGQALLSPYSCVLTGTHPEYHTLSSLNALQEYVDGGGKLAYLGGNGFYWKIGNSSQMPDVIEVRRAEGGTRAWATDPGEYYHALDGTYGGLWLRNRRPPNQLTGVGFSAQGLFEGSYYRRLPTSYDPAMAWMFEGITDEIIGDFGLSGGGAAGFELDRADRALGTPTEAVVVARSEKHQPHFGVTPEDILSMHPLLGGISLDLIRADMTFFENKASGAVFSVGSITFGGSLYHHKYDNNISRLVENVIRHFLGQALDVGAFASRRALRR
jgi:N,N-dimethylformamidase